MRGVVCACLLAMLGATAPARAEDVACPVPDTLAFTGLHLTAARATLQRDGALVILTLGGAATAGHAAGDAQSTWPAQLQSQLSALLPGRRIAVVNEAAPGKATEYSTRNLPKWLADSHAGLVIWGAGAREAARAGDVDAFTAALQAGVEAISAAGADTILLDLQFAPSIARITDADVYRAALAGVAAAADVAFLPRYDLMMAWNDSGVLDLDTQDPAAQREVARRLYACIAEVLASGIAEAVR